MGAKGPALLLRRRWRRLVRRRDGQHILSDAGGKLRLRSICQMRRGSGGGIGKGTSGLVHATPAGGLWGRSRSAHGRENRVGGRRDGVEGVGAFATSTQEKRGGRGGFTTVCSEIFRVRGGRRRMRGGRGRGGSVGVKGGRAERARSARGVTQGYDGLGGRVVDSGVEEIGRAPATARCRRMQTRALGRWNSDVLVDAQSRPRSDGHDGDGGHESVGEREGGRGRGRRREEEPRGRDCPMGSIDKESSMAINCPP